MNLPELYKEEMKELLQEDYDAYLASFDEPRQFGLRVNTLKISVEDFLKISPFTLEPVPWIENGFYFREEDRPAKHPYYYAGLYYIQEPSAMTPANVLPVEEGDIVLDMCAAPGGKSTELGSKLNRTGLLVSNDISASRTKALLKNIEICGISDVLVLNEDPMDLAKNCQGLFDKILIDAPCSGEGMFRKDNKLIKSWEKNGPEFYSKIQQNIIVAGAKMLKPGGCMVFSTCTFSMLEDEESIRHLFREIDDCQLVDIKPYEGFEHGFVTSDFDKEIAIDKTVRIFPHKMKGEGHYVALIRKKVDSDSPSQLPSKICNKVKLPEELQEFLSHIKRQFDPERFEIHGEKVYYMPESSLKIPKLRIVRSGLLMGEIKKNRFEPSQALAMTLSGTDFDNFVSLSCDDERITRYLKGETIDLSDIEGLEKGWLLFNVDGYPLGWGKYIKGQMKNKYLAGWRWM